MHTSIIHLNHYQNIETLVTHEWQTKNLDSDTCSAVLTIVKQYMGALDGMASDNKTLSIALDNTTLEAMKAFKDVQTGEPLPPETVINTLLDDIKRTQEPESSNEAMMMHSVAMSHGWYLWQAMEDGRV